MLDSMSPTMIYCVKLLTSMEYLYSIGYNGISYKTAVMYFYLAKVAPLSDTSEI